MGHALEVDEFWGITTGNTGETMPDQKSRTVKKNAKTATNGAGAGSSHTRHESPSYTSAKTGIARADHMTLAINEVYCKAASGEGVSPSQQAHTMLNAIGKMLCLEGLKLRAGVTKSKMQGRNFFPL
jgi:hypothetical protein